MAKKYQFQYPYAAYMDTSLMRESHTRAEMLAEYKRMRAEAERRLHQLEKYKWTRASEAYQKNVGKFSGGISNLNKTQLAKQMREAAIFIGAQSSTVSGQRKQRERLIYTLKEAWGLDFINNRNVKSFAEFLEAALEHYGASNYTMDDIAALYQTSRRKDIDAQKVGESYGEYMDRLRDSRYYDKYLEQARERFGSDML